MGESNVEAVKELKKARHLSWRISGDLEQILVLKHRIESGEPLRVRCFISTIDVHEESPLKVDKIS